MSHIQSPKLMNMKTLRTIFECFKICVVLSPKCLGNFDEDGSERSIQIVHTHNVHCHIDTELYI